MPTGRKISIYTVCCVKKEMQRPIGIFDSGVGGLTVLKELRHLLPNEDMIYLGDTARVPYGTKSKQTIVRFSIQNALFLLKFRVKLIVVACNTSSSIGLPFLNEFLKTPVIGVVRSSAKEAVRVTTNNRIGVIGTRATINSKAYEREIMKLGRYKVFSKACPLFVPLVEEGILNGEIALKVVASYLKSLIKKDIDTLILGCTHYPLLEDVIKEVIGPDIKVVNSANSVAREARHLLQIRKANSHKSRRGQCSFYVTDEPEVFRRLGGVFFGQKIGKVFRVDLDV